MGAFRRRILITPMAGQVTAALEDDYHCMAVRLDHDGDIITGVEAEMDRWPWTTCPGAADVVKATFLGARLSDAAGCGHKSANCTHLYDLTLFAAAHAGEGAAITYDVIVTDPEGNRVVSELRRDGVSVLFWEMEDGVLVSPTDIAGTNLFHLRNWIATLPPALQEAARILQWATIIARGRSIPIEAQSDASRLPPNCYSFQPERAKTATRIGRILDFSTGPGEPLDHFNGRTFVKQTHAGRVVWPR